MSQTQVRKTIDRWALQWYSRNYLDGETRHFINESYEPKLFRTRQQARDFAKERYGYIKTRKDLRSEPHGWRMPRPVRVKVSIELVGQA